MQEHAAEYRSRVVVFTGPIFGELDPAYRSDRTVQKLRCRKGLRGASVYANAPGVVVRCSSCDGVLLRLVETPTSFWLDVSGLSYLQIDRRGQDPA
jgi:hypothetical protein